MAKRGLIALGALVFGVALALIAGAPPALATTFNASGPTAPNNCAVTFNPTDPDIFTLMINEAPINGSQYMPNNGNGSFIQCLLPMAVPLRTVDIFDPPSVDNGELSNVLTFTTPDNINFYANLYSAGEYNLSTLPSPDVSVTEFNSGGGLASWTIWDPSILGNNCTMSAQGILTNKSGSADCYGILSNTDEAVVPEPSTLALLGAGLFGFVRVRRRKEID